MRSTSSWYQLPPRRCLLTKTHLDNDPDGRFQLNRHSRRRILRLLEAEFYRNVRPRGRGGLCGSPRRSEQLQAWSAAKGKHTFVFGRRAARQARPTRTQGQSSMSAFDGMRTLTSGTLFIAPGYATLVGAGQQLQNRTGIRSLSTIKSIPRRLIAYKALLANAVRIPNAQSNCRMKSMRSFAFEIRTARCPLKPSMIETTTSVKSKSS